MAERQNRRNGRKTERAEEA